MIDIENDFRNINTTAIKSPVKSPKSKYINNVEMEILESLNINIKLMNDIFKIKDKHDLSKLCSTEYTKLINILNEKKEFLLNIVIRHDKSIDLNKKQLQKLEIICNNFNKFLIIIYKLCTSLDSK